MIGSEATQHPRLPAKEAEAAARGAVVREEVATAGALRHVPVDVAASGSGAVTAENLDQLTNSLLETALALGFSSVGVLELSRFDRAAERLEAWLAAGRHGSMEYLVTGGDRADPAALLPEAKAALVVTLPYPAPAPGTVALRRSQSGPPLAESGADEHGADPAHSAPKADTPRGVVAKYARGSDYHTVLKGLLLRLADECARLLGRPVVARACIDTAPLLEREAATRAGLGFVGKNTMAIVPGVGSYLLLGELLLDVPLRPGSVQSRSTRAVTALEGCGKCTQCLTACPTGAFVGPYQLDARRCISYLTIEHSGPIPRDLRPLLGAHVFGCDVCQDVCPFNQTAHKKTFAADLAARPHLAAPELTALLELSSAGYRKLVRGTALRRTHRAQLARNAAVALGNSGDPAGAIPALLRALRAHPAPDVRSHAAWALGRLSAAWPGEEVRAALASAAEHDEEETVREEAAWALNEANSAKR